MKHYRERGEILQGEDFVLLVPFISKYISLQVLNIDYT